MNYIFLIIILLLQAYTKCETDMTNDKIIKKERVIDAGTGRVWDVLTNPKYIVQWLGTITESEWEKGSPIKFKFSWEGKDFIDKGKINVFEEKKRFSYSYWSSFSGLPDKEENYSIITFDLDKDGNHTKLTLTHTNFATETMYQSSGENWDLSLDTIKRIAESD